MNKPNILIADDDANIRMTFRVALETEGCIVALARNAQEALRMASERTFQLLILDLRLGGDNGLKLLADLRQQGVAAPVLLITAYGTVEDAVAAMKLGAIDFLTKPLDPARLRAAVGEILDRAPAGGPEADVRQPWDGSYQASLLEAKRALNARDFGEARKHLTRAVEINPESAVAHHFFGVLLEVNGNADDARRYYRRAHELDPNFGLAPRLTSRGASARDPD
jgi:DNA-binding response OmpR family regulator